jgi:uncharacterized low-complexity protein
MKTKIKQLTLVAGAIVLGAFFTFNVFNAKAEVKTVDNEQTAISMQMEQSSLADIYAIGDEGKCGEGKCGEGKCGEGKAAEKKTSEKKKESKKASKKKAEKKKAEKKKSESKCGEGKCG